LAWLFDIRAAPTQRNDPEFEAAIIARSPDLVKRSPLICLLVKTSTGRMQVTRMSRTDVLEPHIEVDVDAAIKWLQVAAAACTPPKPSRTRDPG
jgi:hypothetical protein